MFSNATRIFGFILVENLAEIRVAICWYDLAQCTAHPHKSFEATSELKALTMLECSVSLQSTTMYALKILVCTS